MKGLFSLCFALVLFVFALPLLTLNGRSAELPEDYEEASAEAAAGAAAYTTIHESSPPAAGAALLDNELKITALIKGEVKTLSMSEYLCGVLAAEMPASFPEEALMAQAVAARTYTMYKKRLYELGTAIPESHKGAIVCDDPRHCKGYIDLDARARELWGEESEKYRAKIAAAVLKTDGKIMVHNNEPIAAVFHAASGPKTEKSADVWGTDTPYLQSVESPGGEASPRYLSDVTVSAEEFRLKFAAKYPDAKLDTAPSEWFKDSTRSDAGGIISVLVGGVRVNGTSVREIFALNSTNFTVTSASDSITFHTTGYGHGVGLSQYGARQMALLGKNCEEILKWYYSGIKITNMSV